MSNEYSSSQIAMDLEIKKSLAQKLNELEKSLLADVIFYFGEIQPGCVAIYRDLIEHIQDNDKHEALAIFLNTPGGSVEVVEQFVNINRYFYDRVYFVVPDYAMSAGTVFCMSGDKIYMDYSSALGPIDPQIYNAKQKMFVPALGYLDKMEEYVKKSKKGDLSEAEFLLLQDQDLAFIKQCEQQKNLTIELIKKWLVMYKFKDWDVSEDKKISCAEDIANQLGDNKKWFSHGRCIDIKCLQDEMNLKIEDYGQVSGLRELIRSYNDLIISYIRRMGYMMFLHSRSNF